MANTTSNIKNMVDKLLANGQLILTGAPGTGKTHLAQRIAAWMIKNPEGTLPENDEGASKEIEKAWNELTGEEKACYKLVQFHPNYSYSDFVEGLKPTTSATGSVSFARKDGIFMDFCNKANQLNKLLIESPSSSSDQEKDVKTDFLDFRVPLFIRG